MNLFRKKRFLSVEFLPLWTGLGSANKSTLLLRWRNVASVSRTESLLHADSPTMWAHHALLVLHSCQYDGWAPLVPQCLLCLKKLFQTGRKRNRLQKDLGASCQAASMDPQSPNQCTQKYWLVMIMLALRGGISSWGRTTIAGLYCRVSRITSTLPTWHFQCCGWDAWTRHRKYVALSKKCTWDEGYTVRERIKALEEMSHLGEWKKKRKPSWRQVVRQTRSE